MTNNIFKVVKIIDQHSLVINAGANKGITTGNVYEIFEIGEEILDPESGESLGTLDFIKAKIKVQNVLPKISICINNENIPNPLANISTFGLSNEPRRLNVDSFDISGPISSSGKIKIGDSVRRPLG